MLNKVLACVAAAVLSSVPDTAAAQDLSTMGARGAAMAGFVAVADDASAVVWNPAGLVTGPIFNIMLDFGGRRQRPSDFRTEDAGAASASTQLIALGTLPLGLAYYRTSHTTAYAAGAAAAESAGRQDRHVIVRTLTVSHLGVTVQQSLGDHVTIGSTLKLLRGHVGVSPGTGRSWDEVFDTAGPVDRRGSTRGDLDVGAMATAGSVRVGLVVRNVTEPGFDEPGGTRVAALPRHARAGIAWGSRWPGQSPTILALDADLTRVTAASGERRDVAAGVERWLRGMQVGLRGGVRVSTIDAPRPVVSAGASYAVRSGIYVDAFVARGQSEDRTWGIAARLTY
jgi:hypothetical protein